MQLCSINWQGNHRIKGYRMQLSMLPTFTRYSIHHCQMTYSDKVNRVKGSNWKCTQRNNVFLGAYCLLWIAGKVYRVAGVNDISWIDHDCINVHLPSITPYHWITAVCLGHVGLENQSLDGWLHWQQHQDDIYCYYWIQALYYRHVFLMTRTSWISAR